VRLINRTARAERGSFSLRKTFVTLTVPIIRVPRESPPSAQAEPVDATLQRFRSRRDRSGSSSRSLDETLAPLRQVARCGLLAPRAGVPVAQFPTPA
jgi:hypothetical protein